MRGGCTGEPGMVAFLAMLKEGRATRPAFLPDELPVEGTEVSRRLWVPDSAAARGWEMLTAGILWLAARRRKWAADGQWLRMVKERGRVKSALRQPHCLPNLA